jgi:cellobiose phosphorylase
MCGINIRRQLRSIWRRNAGYYHGGLLFGTGMRDQFQDILGVVMVEPAAGAIAIAECTELYQFAGRFNPA